MNYLLLCSFIDCCFSVYSTLTVPLKLLFVCVLLLSTEEKKLCCEACKECLMFLFILWNGWSILLVWSCFFCLFGTNFNKKIFLTISQVSVSCTNQSKAGICCHSLLLTTYTPTHWHMHEHTLVGTWFASIISHSKEGWALVWGSLTWEYEEKGFRQKCS